MPRIAYTVARAVAPIAGSVVVHVGIAAVLIATAITVRSREVPAGDIEGVEITLAEPAPVSPPEAAPAPAPLAQAAMPPPPTPPEVASRVVGPDSPAARAIESRLEPGAAPIELEAPATAVASFAGMDSDRAVAVVYVVDASGSMISTIDWVLKELERSIEALSPTQRFQIVMFSRRPDGSAYQMLPNPSGKESLLPATEANKRAAQEWLRTVQPSGMSNPSDGLRRALRFSPDAVFLLSRSIRRSGEGAQWGKGREAILAELDELNPFNSRLGRRRTVIKTIQFVEEDPTGTMQAIGEIHGGERGYTLLTVRDLER